ncbi:MAG: transglutaminase-like domain-containing protein [Muribaculaceae bacterium]|nr:transglutaminase-like domain-containing protein [Muribaculaceae bacterium]
MSKSTYDTVIFEDIPILRGVRTCSVGGVKTLVLKDIGLFDNGIFAMDDLETLIICGTIGKLRPWVASHCPNLRTLIIDANVFSCDDYISFEGCPKLIHIIIRGCFPNSLVQVTDDCMTYFNRETRDKTKFPFENYKQTFGSCSEDKKSKIRERLHETSKWVVKHYGHNQDIDIAIGAGASEMWRFIATAFGSWTRAYKIRKIGWEYNADKKWPTVRWLKRSAEYTPGEDALKFRFDYAPENTEAFRLNRRHFHLRKIAGKGNDYDKMKRLCRWVHENIRHDGKAIPHVYYNLRCLMFATASSGKPGNCFVLAMCLSEALLSIGIKAKYIKGFPPDSNCYQYHVFVAAWSKKLRKWIFLDPTFGAWITDINGNLLSPSEIRQNLLTDVPMIVNDEAEYNGDKSMARTYLSEYLAPNLYYMLANTLSQDETEGDSSHPQGEWVTLIPKGENQGVFIKNPTSDDEYFWQPPK